MTTTFLHQVCVCAICVYAWKSVDEKCGPFELEMNQNNKYMGNENMINLFIILLLLSCFRVDTTNVTFVSSVRVQ